MVLSTGSLKDAKEVKGVVFGEVVMGNSLAKDLKAAVKATTGGRASGYETGLKDARNAALNDMVAEAEKLEADAVMDISVDYEVIAEGSMMVVTAAGTAVTLTE